MPARRRYHRDAIAIRPLLRRVGLDAREAEVYLALLGLRSAPASAVAHHAGQQRSNTYLILRALQKKGLVSEIEKGKIMHFVAESPQRLLSYVRDREREWKGLHMLIEGALPMLSALTGPLAGKPRVTMVSGAEAMKDVYRDVLLEDFIGAFNVERIYALFGENFAESFFGKGADFHGRDMAVDNAAGRRYMRQWPSTKRHQVKLLPKSVRFEGDVIVFGDTIVFFAYDDEKTVVRMENANLAGTLRAWLEVLWSVSRTRDDVRRGA